MEMFPGPWAWVIVREGRHKIEDKFYADRKSGCIVDLGRSENFCASGRLTPTPLHYLQSYTL